ncbi:MAG: hypothetical protein ABIH99_01530, partial [Candidatus Micrarchaeota archaeon]
MTYAHWSILQPQPREVKDAVQKIASRWKIMRPKLADKFEKVTSGIQDKKVVEAIGKGLEIAESTKRFEQTLRYEDINPPVDYLNAIKRCE